MTKILVIDDDRGIQAYVQDCLQMSGYEVDVANDGLEGIRHFKRENYEVVICDILMPEKEGLETIKELQERDRPPVIIACSGGVYRGMDYLPLAKRIGAAEVLYKPFTPTQLRETVAKLLEASAS